MQTKQSLILSVGLYLISAQLIGQQFSDLTTSNEICNFDEIQVTTLPDHGNVYDKLVIPTIQETNSYWIKLDVLKGGELGFIIIPDDLRDDLDFVLYQNVSGELKAIRKMTSGESFINDRNCLGLIGMLPHSLDHNEQIGCEEGADSFVKTTQLLDYQEYYLFINNYHSTNGFSLIFEPTDIVLNKTCVEDLDKLSISLYPTLANDVVNIRSIGEIESNATVGLYNINAKLLGTYPFNKDFNNLDIAYLDPGKYILRFKSGNDFYQKTFIKI